MNRSIAINQDGTIAGISVIDDEFPLACPPFIDFTNFSKMRCINIEKYMDESSWQLVEDLL